MNIVIKMKSLVIFLAVICTVTSQQRRVPKAALGASPLILKQASEVNPDGSFRYSYETENGIRTEESGYLKNPGTPEEAQSVEGSYSYTAPDGSPISVIYHADENGFEAVGDHLPVGPEIPALIAKALAYNAANAGVGGDKDDQIKTKPTPFPILTTTFSQQGFASGVEI